MVLVIGKVIKLTHKGDSFAIRELGKDFKMGKRTMMRRILAISIGIACGFGELLALQRAHILARISMRKHTTA